MRVKTCLIALALTTILVGNHFANAQSAPDPSKSVLQFAQRFEGNLMALAQAMPADKYNFAPNSGVFKSGSPAQFDTVRTFAQQLTHVADMSFMFYAPFGVRPDTAYDSKTLAALTSKDDVIKALQASFDYQNKVIATLTAENAFAPQGPRNANLMGAILVVLNDDGDHYGQLVEYGRMNGVIPPATEKQMQNTKPGAKM